MNSLEQYAEEKLARIEAQGLARTLRPFTTGANAQVSTDDRTFVSFASNDYLGLTQDPAVRAAAAEAADRYGAGAGAARLIADQPLLAALETELAAWLDVEAVVLFGSGYLANVGTIPALVGPNDLVAIDALAPACMHPGAKLSGATVVRFPHQDLYALERLLGTRRAEHPRALVLTEGVFSMDGDRTDTARLTAVARAHDAWLLVDDAHALGVLEGGRGVGGPADVRVGTLSKAFGAYGGFVTASPAVVRLLRHRARTFVYSTGLPPAVAGAALAALGRIRDDPGLCDQPRARARQFAASLGWPTPDAAIVPWVLETPARVIAAQRALEADGMLVGAIRPPTVPAGTARLRFCFSAAHRPDDVERLADAVERLRSEGRTATERGPSQP